MIDIDYLGWEERSNISARIAVLFYGKGRESVRNIRERGGPGKLWSYLEETFYWVIKRKVEESPFTKLNLNQANDCVAWYTAVCYSHAMNYPLQLKERHIGSSQETETEKEDYQTSCFFYPQPSLRNQFRWRGLGYADLNGSGKRDCPTSKTYGRGTSNKRLIFPDEQEISAPTEPGDERTNDYSASGL